MSQDRIDRYQRAHNACREASFSMGILGNEELAEELMNIADSIESRMDAEAEDYEELDEDDDDDREEET